MNAITRDASHPIFHGLKRRALSLGAANALEAALQFLLPVVLARTLDAATFGEYRLLWLAVGTVMAVCLLGMTQALFYFVPRADAAGRRLYIHQALLYLGVVGLAAAFFVSPVNPVLPATLAPLATYGPLVPAFVALWVTACLLDVLPTVEERVGWQVGANATLSILRAATLAAAAFLTHDLGVILICLIALVVLKLAILLAYILRFHGLGGRWLERRAFTDQLKTSAPFGISSSLYGLRIQLDQWVAAATFALSSFAAFSVAAVLAPLVTLFRASVNDAFLPNMSRMQAGDDVRGMLALNGRANVLVAMFVCPILALAFAFATEIVTVVYTATYAEGAPVMRVYILGLAAGLVEVGSILLLLKLGPFALRVNAFALGLSLALSWYGAHHFGLAGAAIGSVAAIWFDRAVTLRRLVRATGVPLRELQDWPALARLAASAAVAAAVAWGVVHLVFPAEPALLRLAVGGSILTLGYALLFLPRWLIERRRALPDPTP